MTLGLQQFSCGMVPIGSSCAGWQVVLSRLSEILNSFIVFQFSVCLKLSCCGFPSVTVAERWNYKLSNAGGWLLNIKMSKYQTI